MGVAVSNTKGASFSGSSYGIGLSGSEVASRLLVGGSDFGLLSGSSNGVTVGFLAGLEGGATVLFLAFRLTERTLPSAPFRVSGTVNCPLVDSSFPILDA